MSDPHRPDEQRYPGQRLGLPEAGSGSVAGWGRRVVALFIDWFASLLAANLVTAYADVGPDTERLLPLLVFFVQVSLFTGVAGASFGQLATRIVIGRIDRRPVNLLQAMIRTFLICLVVPPVVFNRDNRGLHDLAVGTIALER